MVSFRCIQTNLQHVKAASAVLAYILAKEHLDAAFIQKICTDMQNSLQYIMKR